MKYFFLFSFLIFNCLQSQAEEDQSKNDIGEIIVTAEFNEINPFNLPLSVSVLSSNDINQRNASHLEDMLFMTPNVNYSTGSSRGKFYQIRGIGERSEFSEPVNYSVGIVIDGIDFTGIALGASTFDIKQVEVLRGPQGTLYGANALAGLINMVSNDPTEVFYSELTGLISEYGGRNIGAVISGTSDNKFGYRVGIKNTKSNGYIDNIYLNKDDTNNLDETIAKAKFTKSVDNTELVLNIFYADIDNGYDAFSLDNTRETYSDEPGYDRQKTSASSFKLEKRLQNNNRIELLMSYANSDLEYAYDEDWSNTEICNNTSCDSSIYGFDWWYSSFDSFERDNKNHSIDIRYISDSEIFPWVIGVYNRDQDVNLIRQYTYLENNFKSSFDTKNSAIYGQIDANINQKVKVTTGLRFEKRKADYLDNNGPAPEGFFCIAIYPRPESCLFNNRYSNFENFWGGKIAIKNQINKKTMIYALLSRGYKPGGVNIGGKVNQENLNYDSETMWNYEAGVKTSIMDNTLFIQASVFYQDRDDVQTKQSLIASIKSGIEGGECPCSFTDYIGNAASGSNQGLELEILWLITDRLEISSSLGILETEFKNFQSYSHIEADLSNGLAFDLSGRDQSHAPNYQFNFFLNYKINENIFINFNVESKDKFYFSDRHSAQSDSYTLLNFLIGYKLDSWEINIFGKNLTDEDYATRGFGSFGNDPRKFFVTEPYDQYASPRVIGVSGKKSF
ncbi:TonB-dependent receptor [Hyphomicrobiales bacterium]|nr:TonB-dependent receptor [Hyphomicrobiales bacterium]